MFVIMTQLCVLLCLLYAGTHAISPPSQVSIAAGVDGSSQVAFTWLTDDPRDDDESCAQVAVVHVFRFLQHHTSTGTCSRYSFGASPDTFGNYTSGRIHRVRVSGLEPNVEYTYTLQGSPFRHRFRTMPASTPSSDGKDDRYPFAFGVVGDLGISPHSVETVRHVGSDASLRAVLHVGDLSYADTNGPKWDVYGNMIEPVASKVQWMPCPGNHEIESDFYTGMNFVPWEARHSMPEVKAAENKPAYEQIGCKHPWGKVSQIRREIDCTPSRQIVSYDWGNSFYAFNAGPARVITLNCYTNTFPGSPQHTWLKSELESLRGRRAATPWLIVMLHCPWYNSNKRHQGEPPTVLMRDTHGFEDLFYEHNVSIVLAGHVHAYERSRPVYRNVSGQGPTYIVIGNGGNREGLVPHFRDPKPEWSAFSNGVSHGHGRLEIVNDTHMRWDWLINDESRPPKVSQSEAERMVHERNDTFRRLERKLQWAWTRSLAHRASDDSAWIVNPRNRPLDLPMHMSLAPATFSRESWYCPPPWARDLFACGCFAAVILTFSAVTMKKRHQHRLKQSDSHTELPEAK